MQGSPGAEPELEAAVAGPQERMGALVSYSPGNLSSNGDGNIHFRGLQGQLPETMYTQHAQSVRGPSLLLYVTSLLLVRV